MRPQHACRAINRRFVLEVDMVRNLTGKQVVIGKTLYTVLDFRCLTFIFLHIDYISILQHFERLTWNIYNKSQNKHRIKYTDIHLFYSLSFKIHFTEYWQCYTRRWWIISKLYTNHAFTPSQTGRINVLP